MNINQAKQLKIAEVIHSNVFGKCDCRKWIVKESDIENDNPNEVKVLLMNQSLKTTPLTKSNIQFVHTIEDCPFYQNKRLSYSEAIEFHLTKDDLAKHYGLKSFDTAIPQDVFDELEMDSFHFVYCYDNSMFGFLFPLTIEGENRMNELDWPIPETKVIDKTKCHNCSYWDYCRERINSKIHSNCPQMNKENK
jgi:hypothetical protein